jgi:hypothetical protein
VTRHGVLRTEQGRVPKAPTNITTMDRLPGTRSKVAGTTPNYNVRQWQRYSKGIHVLPIMYCPSCTAHQPCEWSVAE